MTSRKLTLVAAIAGLQGRRDWLREILGRIDDRHGLENVRLVFMGLGGGAEDDQVFFTALVRIGTWSERAIFLKDSLTERRNPQSFSEKIFLETLRDEWSSRHFHFQSGLILSKRPDVERFELRLDGEPQAILLDDENGFLVERIEP